MSNKVEKQKRLLLACYCIAKRADKKLINKPVPRDRFLRVNRKKPEIVNARRIIDEIFGSYTNFMDAGEKRFYDTLPKAERALLSERAKKFDPSITKDQCIEDLRFLQSQHPTKYIVRNFYREEGKYSDSTWNQHFGTFHEFRRAAGLELNRHQHRLEKEIAKHAAHDIYRDFYDREILPYLNAYERPIIHTERYKTMMVSSDWHDIDTDPFMAGIFVDTARRIQPHIIVLNGDVFDCYDSSKYDKDIRDLKIVERFKFIHEKLFAPLREACPDTQIDFILGNHEWRIVNMLANKTPNFRVVLSDLMGLSLADVFGLRKYKINLICKVDLGAFTEKDRQNELRKNYKIYYDSYVVSHFKDTGHGLSGTSGHCHRPNTETYTNSVRGKCSWVETGCMCYTEAEYVPHRDKWTQSFVIAHIDTLEKTVNQEHIIVAGAQAVVHGIRYERKPEVEP